MRSSQKKPLAMMLAMAVSLAATPAHAMHIADGILPLPWAGLWWLVALPFLLDGLRELTSFRGAAQSRSGVDRTLVGMMGAAVLVLSSIPLPVPTAGTTSHLCGTGLAALFVGPRLTIVVTSVVLVFQALLLGHGGLTALGAGVVSMGVAAAYVAFAVFSMARRLGLSTAPAAFLAGVLSDWATYAMTSLQLASALHGQGSLLSASVATLVAFLPTQLPLGILEGVVVAMACGFVHARRPDLLRRGLGGSDD